MRILYLGLNPTMEETYGQIVRGEIPSDRMYGLVELKELGFDVSFMSISPRGSLLKAANKKFGLNMTDLNVLRALSKYDVIVVIGPFSTFITLAANFFNKKLVYLDTILRMPNHWLRKFLFKFNTVNSSGTVMYTDTQARECAETMGVDYRIFKQIPFAIDFSFYKRFSWKTSVETPFILAVGRDQARDYKTLVEAARELGVKVKLVTLSYLLKDVDLSQGEFEILENVSYEELYQLYAEALFVVIPLKKWGTQYSSGTRALLEAMAMGKCVIASHSQPLEEYAEEGEGVLYVKPEDAQELQRTIRELMENSEKLSELETRGREIAKEKYDIKSFAVVFGKYLSDL